MNREVNHRESVEAWLAGAADATPEQCVRLFEVGMNALLGRTRLTLGEVTLAAIVDRVIYSAAEKYPAFASVKVEPSGALLYDKLLEIAATLPNGELISGMHFVILEFLTVLGNLTAEILTPELHAALAKVSPQMPASKSDGNFKP